VQRTAIIGGSDHNKWWFVPAISAPGLKGLTDNYRNWTQVICTWDRNHRECGSRLVGSWADSVKGKGIFG
jgi:hypothetical protein